jgi:hypothetical protein
MVTTISIDLLKTVLNNQHLPAIMSGGATHDPTLKFVAALVRAGLDDKLIEDLVNAALPPDYSGNTRDEVLEMIAGAHKKDFTNELEPTCAATEPTRHSRPTRRDSAQVALDAIEDLVELFHDDRGKSYLSIGTELGGRLCYEVDSEPGRDIVQKIYYDASGGRALPEQKQKDVIRTLKARAKFDGIERPVHRRVARHGNNVYIDLGTSTGEVVQITSNGFSVVTDCPVAFVRSATMRSLPKPVQGGSLKMLADILQVDEDTSPLLYGFLLNCVRGEGPYLFLLVEGPQGSGKSFLCGAIKKLIDPDIAERIRLPRDEQALMLHAMNFFLPVYDNASGMRGDISDALCSISTGSAIVDRTHYTNEHISVLAAKRPFVINGIAEVVNRPDLLERAILLELKPLDRRYAESDLEIALATAAPQILGALYNAVACALRHESQHTSAGEVRMHDAARWITAAEPEIGLPPGSFVKALTVQQSEVAIERVSNQPIVGRLRSLLNAGPFNGSMQELFVKTCANHNFSPALPQGPGQLSKLLKRLAPQLKTINIHFDIRRTNKGSHVRVWNDDHNQPTSVGGTSLFQEGPGGSLSFREEMAMKSLALLGRRRDDDDDEYGDDGDDGDGRHPSPTLQ